MRNKTLVELTSARDVINAEIERRIAAGQDAIHQLACIRATLLVNFGDTDRNCYGITLADAGSTHDLVMKVLKYLTEPRCETCDGTGSVYIGEYPPLERGPCPACDGRQEIPSPREMRGT